LPKAYLKIRRLRFKFLFKCCNGSGRFAESIF
jgi:hypothetical protein